MDSKPWTQGEAAVPVAEHPLCSMHTGCHGHKKETSLFVTTRGDPEGMVLGDMAEKDKPRVTSLTKVKQQEGGLGLR